MPESEPCLSTPKITAAIDIGGQSIRIGLFDNTGRKLRLCQEPLDTIFLGHKAEQSPGQLLSCFRRLETQIKDFCCEQDLTLASVGICGPGASFLCWRRSTLESLSPIISWQDIRGSEYWQGLNEIQGQTITGLRASHFFGAGKYRYCLEHLDAVKHAAKDHDLCMGPISSYLIAHLHPDRLSGVDKGHGQRSYLMNSDTGLWDNFLCRHFGIQPEHLPAPYQLPTTIHLAGQSTTLNHSWRDQGAALFTSGQPSKSACYLNLGTGVFLQCLGQELNQTPSGWNSAPFATDHQTASVWEASINLGASSLRWLCEILKLTRQTAQALLQQTAYDTPEGLNTLMTGSPHGLGTPFWRPLEPEFLQCSDAADYLNAWLDNLVFSIFLCLEELPNFRQSLFISGGLSHTAGLLERLSALYNGAIIKLDDSEASLTGCAFLAAGQPSSWYKTPTIPFAPKLHTKQQEKIKQRYEYWRARLLERIGSQCEG